MRRLPPLAPLALALALSPTFGHAAFNLTDATLQCSGAFNVQAGDAFNYACTGNLSLTGTSAQSSLQADDSITLSATGDISLAHLTLISPNIDVHTDSGAIIWNADVTVFSQAGHVNPPPAVQLSAGSILVNPSLTPSQPGAGLSLSGNDGTATVPAIELDANPGTVTIVPGGSLTLTAVPEPSSWMMTVCGLALLLAMGSRRQSR